jgi:hypothetical protein
MDDPYAAPTTHGRIDAFDDSVQCLLDDRIIPPFPSTYLR